VLFNAPANGEFTWTGVIWIAAALSMWSTYLLTSRTLRQGRTVAAVMASITPIATLVTLVVGLLFARDDLTAITWRSVVFIALLAVLTGTVAHGLMVFAQHSVPIGVISMMQVSQPGLSVLWSVLFLSSSVRPIQLLGMALVITGLALVTIQTQRARD
jgi:drug/metabolite transporter (DMT)-like permease